jgi:hypothetical protein
MLKLLQIFQNASVSNFVGVTFRFSRCYDRLVPPYGNHSELMRMTGEESRTNRAKGTTFLLSLSVESPRQGAINT